MLPRPLTPGDASHRPPFPFPSALTHFESARLETARQIGSLAVGSAHQRLVEHLGSAGSWPLSRLLGEEWQDNLVHLSSWATLY